jgi:hypothetical protein
VSQCAPDELNCITLQQFTVFRNVLNTLNSKKKRAIPRNRLNAMQGAIGYDLDFRVGVPSATYNLLTVLTGKT